MKRMPAPTDGRAAVSSAPRARGRSVPGPTEGSDNGSAHPTGLNRAASVGAAGVGSASDAASFFEDGRAAKEHADAINEDRWQEPGWGQTTQPVNLSRSPTADRAAAAEGSEDLKPLARGGDPSVAAPAGTPGGRRMARRTAAKPESGPRSRRRTRPAATLSAVET